MVDAIIIVIQLIILFEVWYQKKEVKTEKPKEEKSKIDIFNKWMYGKIDRR